MEVCRRTNQRTTVSHYVSCGNRSCSSCHTRRSIARSKVLQDLEVKDGGSGEMTGLVTLLLCGVYTITMFLVAALVERIAAKVFPPDGKINCKVDYHEQVKLMKKLDINCNNSSDGSETSKRVRTFSHG